MCLHSAYEAGGAVYARDLATAEASARSASSNEAASAEPTSYAVAEPSPNAIRRPPADGRPARETVECATDRYRRVADGSLRTAPIDVRR
ncbi:hypothetical protein GCM10017608_15380 [Agromyces luteolus]|nr:hypothetical protein GCM10017608_15380 [Agromyces luteolus]